MQETRLYGRNLKMEISKLKHDKIHREITNKQTTELKTKLLCGLRIIDTNPDSCL